MGALHEGHAKLVDTARAECASVVVSIFVNPLQFNEASDLDAYPRTLESDAELLQGHGCDLVFAPERTEIYPEDFATNVTVNGVTDGYEGAHRPGHFDGVATVVAKLFGIVGANRAYFGRKDAQQLALIRSLVRDLDMPVTIVSVATVRAPDGLALSSRNARLSAGERTRALGISAGLFRARDAWRDGERDLEALLALARDPSLDYEYLAAVDPATFRTPQPDGPVLLVTAVRVGATRLIDNVELE